MKIILGILFGGLLLAKPLQAQTPHSLLVAHFEKKLELTESKRKIPLRISNNPIKIPFQFLLWVYQSQITHQLATNCPYQPSCSEFAKQAIQECGTIKGILLTADRLTRCNSATVQKLPTNSVGKVEDFPSDYRIKP
ncbi:MAG: membrane protein insertion efficiency factor YidD [Bacteroidia bacterium]|nr:membrane protein insertion efficiency factor YidD [Bacteroidia bacterium]